MTRRHFLDAIAESDLYDWRAGDDDPDLDDVDDDDVDDDDDFADEDDLDDDGDVEDLDDELSPANVVERLTKAAADAPTIRPNGTFVWAAVGQCRRCGCTEQFPCLGGCVWAEPNLCSRCAREVS